MEHDVMVYPTDPRVRTDASTVRGAALAVKLLLLTVAPGTEGLGAVLLHLAFLPRMYRHRRLPPRDAVLPCRAADNA